MSLVLMEITKVVKPFIRRGCPNTFGNIVYVVNDGSCDHSWQIMPKPKTTNLPHSVLLCHFCTATNKCIRRTNFDVGLLIRWDLTKTEGRDIAPHIESLGYASPCVTGIQKIPWK